MNDNTQSRKWLLTLNNPKEYGLDHQRIQDLLLLFSPTYYCMADEIGKENGTYHTHVFLYSSKSAIRFLTIKKRFPIAHIDKVVGTARDNRNYILKQGKYANTEKAETSVENTFVEWGELPAEKEEKSPKIYKLLQDVKDGMSTMEIIEQDASYSFRIKDINLLRDTVLYEKYRKEKRKVDVAYMYGGANSEKTAYIYNLYPAENICRINEYNHNGMRFDNYSGQDVLVFENFEGQISLASMLIYLDEYPVILPARYNDKVACYTKVYISSDLPLEKQYISEQKYKPNSYSELLQKINKILLFNPGGHIEEIDFGGEHVQ